MSKINIKNFSDIKKLKPGTFFRKIFSIGENNGEFTQIVSTNSQDHIVANKNNQKIHMSLPTGSYSEINDLNQLIYKEYHNDLEKSTVSIIYEVYEDEGLTIEEMERKYMNEPLYLGHIPSDISSIQQRSFLNKNLGYLTPNGASNDSDMEILEFSSNDVKIIGNYIDNYMLDIISPFNSEKYCSETAQIVIMKDLDGNKKAIIMTNSEIIIANNVSVYQNHNVKYLDIIVEEGNTPFVLKVNEKFYQIVSESSGLGFDYNKFCEYNVNENELNLVQEIL